MLRRRPLAAALLLVAFTLPDLVAQTLEDVRWALDRLGRGERARERAEEQLEAWGDAALPHLAVLLDDPDFAVRLDARLVLYEQYTPGSTELLLAVVERCEGETLISPEIAARLAQSVDLDPSFTRLQLCLECSSIYGELVGRAVVPETRALARGERYRSVMLAVAERFPDEPGVQDGLARVVALLEWRDEIPRLRALLDHADRTVRATAAEALELLTGERPGPPPLPAVFPAEALDEGLVVHVGDIGYAYVDFAFGLWDGAHRLVLPGDPQAIEVRDEHLELVRRMVLEDVIGSVFAAPTPDGGQQFLCDLTVDDDELSGDVLAGLDERGEARWRRSLDGGSLEVMVPLYRDGVVAGMLVDVEEADDVNTLAALDLDGAVLWSYQLEYESVYDVHPRLFSHPAFRSLVSITGEGWYDVLDADGEDLVRDETPVAAFLRVLAEEALRTAARPSAPVVVTQAIPVPRGRHRHAMILGGLRLPDEVPVLQRVDIEDTVTWSATLPSPVAGLCLLEPEPGRPWMVVAATVSGEFFVVQDDGTLVHRGRFEETRLAHGADRAAVMLSHIAGGRLGEHSAFAISASELNVYRLREPSDAADER